MKVPAFLSVIVFTTCLVTNAATQPLNGDKIIPGDTLKWECFTGIPDSASAYWATTNWGVYYKYKVRLIHLDTVKVDLEVWHVLKAKSWVLKDKQSEQLLHHEQGHFNLAILCEAEFKKTIDSTVLLLQDYDKKIDAAFNSVLNNINQMEIQYDKETNHMYNIEEQKNWDAKIKKLLKETQ